MEAFRTDKPLDSQVKDKFQRSEFSKRIATILSDIKNDKSLVVGLYGKWGEGKTSIMNMVDQALSSEVVKIHFNPWLFSGEDQLLRSFFDYFAFALDGSVKSKKEKIGELLSDYAGSIGMITQFAGVSTGGLEKLGKKLKENSVEKIKNKLDDLIIKSNKNIVVFIDDIDRLDATEIQAVFKLVKLAGDFPRTSYVLAFDDEMVSKALAPKYGTSDSADGRHFLEKIIQVPLNIPKANTKALSDYVLSQVEEVLKNNKADITQSQLNTFIQNFDEYFLPEIDNPRIGIRYANTLSFSIPLLNGEIHITDLMVVEGLKIFYTEFYNTLRDNPALFVGNPSTKIDILNKEYVTQEERRKILEKKIESCTYSERKSKRLLNLIQSLFPQLKGIFSNNFFPDELYNRWYREKKICSANYFSRYFSYVVLDGDISDVFFEEIFSNLESNSAEDLTTRFSEKFKLVKPADLIFKLRHWENEFSDAQATHLALALSKMGQYFLLNDRDERITPPLAQAAIFISRLLIRLQGPDRGKITLQVLLQADPLQFSLAIKYWLIHRNLNDDRQKAFSDEEEEKMRNELVDRFKLELQNSSFFNLLPENDLGLLLEWWSESKEKAELSLSIQSILSKGNGSALKLLKVFTPSLINYTGPDGSQGGKVNFNEESYKYIEKVFNPQWLFEALNTEYGDLSELSREIKIAPGVPLPDNMLISLFQNFHLNFTENKNG